MKNIFTAVLFLGTLCLRSSAFARMNKPPFLHMRPIKLNSIISSNAAGDDSLLDAEEAAAIDAHDISDPGIEAAAMERAVMLAQEYKEEQMKNNNKKKKDHIKSVEEHYKEVEKDIAAIERLIKEADEADHASVRRAVLV